MINTRYTDVIKNAFQDPQEFEDFLSCCQLPLKKSIKINENKISVQEFIELTKEHWRKLSLPLETSHNDTFYIDRDDHSLALWNSFLHQAWFFYIQEIAASMPPKAMDIENDQLILDISAAPWWKTIQISDYLNWTWFVVSNDMDWKRVRSLGFNINRMWAYNVWVSNFNGFVFWKNVPEIFDTILVDAPCSWEWTGFKSDFALKIRRIEEIRKIAGTQHQLLISAFKALKVWGEIIYSTCTVNPYENELQLTRLKEIFGDWISIENVDLPQKSNWLENFWEEKILNKIDAEKVARFWPHKQKTWGFFVSKIKKLSSTLEKSKPQKLVWRQSVKIESQNPKDALAILKDHYWIELEKYQMLYKSWKQFCLTTKKALELVDKMDFEKIWVQVLRHDLVPVHFLGTCLGDKATKNYVNLTWDQAQAYSQGWEISFEDVDMSQVDNTTRYIILKWENKGLSVWKLMEGYIKNKFMKS